MERGHRKQAGQTAGVGDVTGRRGRCPSVLDPAAGGSVHRWWHSGAAVEVLLVCSQLPSTPFSTYTGGVMVGQ